MKKIILTLLFSAIYSLVFAQEKEIDTVYVFDKQIDNVKNNQFVKRISNEDIQKNSSNLSEVLRFQSDVFIKENGRGMVSAPSFRGTTAQQTAFVWNGINLNSIFLGQGDINNLSLLSYDDIDVVAGGGSVIYGSGAIGGSVHLNNHLEFNQGMHAQLFFEGGSFKTFNTALKAKVSNNKWSFSVGINHATSKNDYKVPERKYENINGKYKNIGLNLGLGYKFNKYNQISAFYHRDRGEQFYPIFEMTQNKTKYNTRNQRLLTAWDFNKNKISNTFNVAYINEEFDYFSLIDEPRTSGGIGNTFLAKNDLKYKLNSHFRLNFITEFKHERGEGYQSGIQNPKRNSGYITSVLKYNPIKKLSLDVGLKKEFNDREEAPFLYSLTGSYQPTKWYNMNLNLSKNYRAPTFNDLYWNPGGNLELKSETSYQISMDQMFSYGDFSFRISPYYMKIKDMIQWLPTSNGYWAPINTNNVESYGWDSSIKWTKKWNDWSTNLGLGYNFTHSVNLDTKKQLSYVPKNRFNINGDLKYRNWSLYVQGIYNGLTFTETNENPKTALQDYFVANMGLNVKLYEIITLGLKINNVTDAIYETKEYYPLPKRHYALHVNIDI